MTAEICSCKGLDQNCKKCFGSGYVNTGSAKKSTEKSKEPKPRANRKSSMVPENLSTLGKAEVEKIAEDIISGLDLKSKKQMQILNSIPFNTNTFRRDFPEKFESLELLENEKQRLRNDLFTVEQEIVSKNYQSSFRFKHYLSDKDIDASSNRQLKELIREYKKLKSTAGK